MALKLAVQTFDDLRPDEQALATSEAHWIIRLSREMGMPARYMLSLMGSREYTEYRAAALIEIAQDKIMEQQRRQQQVQRPRRR